MIWLVAILLVPIIPAAILFAFLPKGRSTGSVHGKLEGFHFKFGGAFAGYIFVLVFATRFLLPGVWDFVASNQTWDVIGYIDKNDPKFNPKMVHLIVDPPGAPVDLSGKFIISFKPPTGKLEDLPCIQVEVPAEDGYGHVTANLLRQGDAIPVGQSAFQALTKTIPVVIDFKRRRIYLTAPISLDKLTNYTPDAPSSNKSLVLGGYGTGGTR